VVHYLVNVLRMTGRRRLLLGQSFVAGVLALVLLVVALRAGAAAVQQGLEMDLKDDGQAWELNPDHNGDLWISDYAAGEIWQVNPATDVYTIYEKISGASDARLDANGDLWWADFNNYGFGRLELDGNVRTTWPLTGAVIGRATGLNFDDQGRVWITDGSRPDLYSFDPRNDEFCHYKLPKQIRGWYVVAHDGFLWMVAALQPYVLRIDPDDGSYATWHYHELGSNSHARGLAFDDQGNLWWSGYNGQSSLFWLILESNFVYEFALPGGKGWPTMVDAGQGFVWYGDELTEDGAFGRLDPQSASKESSRVLPESIPPRFTCYADWQPTGGGSGNVSSASASWSAGTYTTTVDADGWRVYQLPDDTPDGVDPVGAWGIRALDSGTWIVDQDRQKLVHIRWNHVFIPRIDR
jgi:streptogramin lyase